MDNRLSALGYLSRYLAKSNVQSIRKIIATSDSEALVEYADQIFGFEITVADATRILAWSADFGGTKAQPWSDGTWNVWTKSQIKKITDPRPTVDKEARTRLSLIELANGKTFSSQGVTFTTISDMVQLSSHLSDQQTWTRQFPVSENVTKFIEAAFNKLGGDDLLAGAPFSSWLYARLYTMGIKPEIENDLGGFSLNALVTNNSVPEAFVDVAADGGDWTAVIEARTKEVMQFVRPAFQNFLLSDIHDVAVCDLKIEAVELQHTNQYGWNGNHFFGYTNMRE